MFKKINYVWMALLSAFSLGLFPQSLYAQDQLSSGDSSWVMTATALVLLMTLPGLALFYGGLVRARSFLATIMHCLVIACVASVFWLLFGYGWTFGDGGSMNAWIGDLSFFAFGGGAVSDMSGSIPTLSFFAFQMTFAIITPALVVGVWVERVRFAFVPLFALLFLALIYAPVAHWIWGGGFLAELGVIDFAGGLVVHTTAGVTALVLAIMMRSRNGFPHHLSPPHSPSMVFIGAALLWVGWFGFNGGSALAADVSAAAAITATHIAACAAVLTWMVMEYIRYKKVTLIGAVTALIAGLATITPAAGNTAPLAALFVGIIAGIVCFAAVLIVKQRFEIDDSLDVFAVHGVGGMTGTLLVAFTASPTFGGSSTVPAFEQLCIQAYAIGIVAIWSAVMTLLIVAIAKVVTGLTVSKDEEQEGLDLVAHGEKAYEW